MKPLTSLTRLLRLSLLACVLPTISGAQTGVGTKCVRSDFL